MTTTHRTGEVEHGDHRRDHEARGPGGKSDAGPARDPAPRGGDSARACEGADRHEGAGPLRDRTSEARELTPETFGDACDRTLAEIASLPWPLRWWYRRKIAASRARVAKSIDRAVVEPIALDRGIWREAFERADADRHRLLAEVTDLRIRLSHEDLARKKIGLYAEAVESARAKPCGPNCYEMDRCARCVAVEDAERALADAAIAQRGRAQ
jgi:hypothetical protein